MAGKDRTNLLEDLLGLRDDRRFQLFLALLQDGQKQMALQLNTVLTTPEQVAQHNRLVGMLENHAKVIGFVDKLITELELEEKTHAK